MVMFAFIILVIFGIGVAFFATQNTQTISITLANYPLTGIPTYLIVLCSLLLGFLVSWIISFVDVISSALKIHGKESTIKKANKQIAELTKKVHQLELENERLKGESGHPRDDKSL
jgi:putative membrane protein